MGIRSQQVLAQLSKTILSGAAIIGFVATTFLGVGLRQSCCRRFQLAWHYHGRSESRSSRMECQEKDLGQSRLQRQ